MPRGLPATDVCIIGAGPAGTLLALLLAARGRRVALYERRDDPRSAAAEAGRSINLALAARGLRALEQAGMLEALTGLLVPLRGRQLHASDGAQQFAVYGQRPEEVIHSISRAALTRRLVEAAADQPGIALHFGQRCIGLAADGAAQFRDERSGDMHEVHAGRWIAADGAGSAVRHTLAAQGLLQQREELLDHDYKELSIPAVDGKPALSTDALHIWPRGGYMLIALPNADASFTATLFLPRTGTTSFASLADVRKARAFFAREFPDALAAMPDFDREFATHPQGLLGSVHCKPWNQDERLLLIGDAAHAIVPFHGQGMNCAFEDCRILDALLADGAPSPFSRFAAARRPDTEAIAQMALENYGEMRDSVRSPLFLQHRQLSLELERRHPRRFVPRYSMVMFHAEIPYSDALRRGETQQHILDQLLPVAAADAALIFGTIDWARATQLIETSLPPL